MCASSVVPWCCVFGAWKVFQGEFQESVGRAYPLPDTSYPECVRDNWKEYALQKEGTFDENVPDEQTGRQTSSQL